MFDNSEVSGVIVENSPAGCNDLATRTKNELRRCIIEYVNGLREELTRNPVRQLEGLNTGAQRHAHTMAVTKELFHTPALEDEIDQWIGVAWSWAAEDIGVGSDFDNLMQAFRESKLHYSNMVKLRANHIGVGVVFESDQLWVTMWLVDID